MLRYVAIATVFHVLIVGLLMSNGPIRGNVEKIVLISPGEEEKEEKEPDKVEKPKPIRSNFYTGDAKKSPQKSVEQEIRERKAAGQVNKSEHNDVSTSDIPTETALPAADYTQSGINAPAFYTSLSEKDMHRLVQNGWALWSLSPLDSRIVATDGKTTGFLQGGGIWQGSTYAGRGLEIDDEKYQSLRDIRQRLETAANDLGFARNQVQKCKIRLTFLATLDNRILTRQEDAAVKLKVKMEDIVRTVGHLNVSDDSFEYVITRLEMKDGKKLEVKA